MIAAMDTLSSKIIDACGGTTAVARLLKRPVSTVHSWRRLGFTEYTLDHLKLAAAAEGLPVDFERGVRLDHVDPDAASSADSSSGRTDDISRPETAFAATDRALSGASA